MSQFTDKTFFFKCQRLVTFYFLTHEIDLLDILTFAYYTRTTMEGKLFLLLMAISSHSYNCSGSYTTLSRVIESLGDVSGRGWGSSSSSTRGSSGRTTRFRTVYKLLEPLERSRKHFGTSLCMLYVEWPSFRIFLRTWVHLHDEARTWKNASNRS